MFGLEKLFGSDEAGEAGEIEAAAAKEAAAKYAEQAAKERGEYTKYGEIARGDISGGLTKAQEYGEPFRKSGRESLDTYMASLGLKGPSEYQKVVDTFQKGLGYQFSLEEGRKALESSAAAKGLQMSGGMLKELQTYGQGVANQTYNAWQDRLARQAEFGGQMGEQAAGREMQAGSGLSAVSERTGSQTGQSYRAQGEAEAGAALGAGAARAGALRQQGAAGAAGAGLLAGALGSIAGGPVGGWASKKIFGE